MLLMVPYRVGVTEYKQLNFSNIELKHTISRVG